MNAIYVYDDIEGGYKKLYSLYDSSMMASRSERWYYTRDRRKILPGIVCDLFDSWAKDSTYDGDNKSVNLCYNGVNYVFHNFYWD